MIIIPTEKQFDWRRAPKVILLLVGINILAFFLYQSGDKIKYQQALQIYTDDNYLEKEFPIYIAYLQTKNNPVAIQQATTLYESDRQETLILDLVSNTEFYQYLRTHARLYFFEDFYEIWSIKRQEVHEQIQAISVYAHGLRGGDFKPLSLITYQFLHGNTLHLLSNLFFLVVCGFAVEASIGHRRFIAFYLLSGMAAGLIHLLLDRDAQDPLVGASGSISGVMAMYLVIFRMRQIEFFYWFTILVGYFRAPALVILPFYLGKELLLYFTSINSGIAFMAHFGGFIAGAGALGLASRFFPRTINQAYVEEKQDEDPKQKSLSDIYDAIEALQFETAAQLINRSRETYGDSFELVKLRYVTDQWLGKPVVNDSLTALFQINKINPGEAVRLAHIWQRHKNIAVQLSDKQLIELGMRLTNHEYISEAEQIITLLIERNCTQTALGIFAKKLANFYSQQKNSEKLHRYSKLARDLMGSDGLL